MTNTVRFINSIHHIGAKTWCELLNSDNPFLRFEFLAALEDGLCIDSISPSSDLNSSDLKSGWIVSYALLENPEQKILAIAPVFKKLHSYGEYVFDWSWADAYEQHGLHYYPKLVWAIPFTPSTGPRIISQGNPQQLGLYYQQIAQGLTAYCQANNFSGWHCLFPDAIADQALNHDSLNQQFTSLPSMQRTSCQFHWFNNNFNDFTHYLESLTSRKRKNIKKERSRLLAAGFIFTKKVADQITPTDIEEFYRCYQLTYAKRNMRGYLSLEFFQQLLVTMSDQLLLVQAQTFYSQPENNQQDSKIVANALYFKDSDNLYGRYWGCLEEFDSLHFEVCYYQGIEYCIENGISHFDPGTQGEHKISRGFEPTICHSQHWIAHPQFRQAIDDFLQREKLDIQDYAAQAAQYLPFKYSD